MLRQLAIRNVVLIDKLELEFDSGLGVLTGETGAGKSILLDSLGLALGARADSALVRHGSDSASVSAEIELPPDHPAHGFLKDQGLGCDSGEPLLLRRTLKSDGGSRAFIGAASVPAGVVRDAASMLVEIHGQQDDRGLLNPRGHRALLDAFGALDVAPIEEAWARVSQIENDLAQARAEAAEAERDRDYLEHAVGEIETLAPQPGEETSLAEERAAIQAGAKAGETLEGIDELLGGSDGALAQLRQAARRIERGAADHAALAEALAALDRALIEAHDAEDKIARAGEALAYDPARLDAVEARLFDIRGLARKHRVEADTLAELGEKMRAQLAQLDAGGERIEALDAQLRQARLDYSEQAAQLSRRRHEAAAKLDEAVAGELSPLKLDSARFRTAIGESEAGAAGTDRVEFEVSTNPGAPFGPLTKIASGGELSRFILALKVALAEAGSAATMIFDEIDRGVGGAVASAIGERLARLAKEVAGACRHSLAAGGGAGGAPLPDRKVQRGWRDQDFCAPPKHRRAARGDRANAFGSGDYRRGEGPGIAAAGRRVTGYVALLRAVNVGGRKLLMSDLKRIAGELGHDGARTYIASGNLLIRSSKSERAVKLELQRALTAHMGKQVDVMIRSAGELEGVVADNPFADEAGNRVAAIFLDSAPPKDICEHAKNRDGERLAVGSREIYVHYPDGMGQSKLRIPAAATGTARNMNTVAKLAELAREME